MAEAALPLHEAAVVAVAELPVQFAAVVAVAAFPVVVVAEVAVAELPVHVAAVVAVAALPVVVVAEVAVAALPDIFIAYKLLVAASTHELPFHFCHLEAEDENLTALVGTFVGVVVAGSRAKAKSLNLAFISVTKLVYVLLRAGFEKSAIFNYL